MKQGRRYIRNTILLLIGVTVSGVAANRIYAAVVDADSAPWVRGLLSLGLQVQENRTPAMQAVDVADAARLRFTQVSVEGAFTVEVVSAPAHRVSLTHRSGQPWTVSAEGQQDGLLRLKGDDGSGGGTLRIEAPALYSIEAQDSMLLAIRGWQAPELSVRMKNVGGVRLEQSAVERWTLHSDIPVAVEADAATMAAGLDVRTSGEFSLHGAGGQKVQLQGSNAHVIIRSRK